MYYNRADRSFDYLTPTKQLQQPSTICTRDMMAYLNRGKNPHFPLISLSFPRSLSPESAVKWVLLQYHHKPLFKKVDTDAHAQVFRGQNIHITKTWQKCVRSGMKTHMHGQIACKNSVPKIMSSNQAWAGTKTRTHTHTRPGLFSLSLSLFIIDATTSHHFSCTNMCNTI